MKTIANILSRVSCAFQSKIADCQLFLNLTLPIRVAYAKDSGQHSLAADEHANFYYSGGSIAPAPWHHQAKVYTHGFISGLLVKHVPQYFIDSWFQDSASQEAAPADQVEIAELDSFKPVEGDR